MNSLHVLEKKSQFSMMRRKSEDSYFILRVPSQSCEAILSKLKFPGICTVTHTYSKVIK